MQKPIKQNPNYFIDELGNVFSSKRGMKRLAWRFDDKGYPMVHFANNGKQRNFKVHRLVAESFIENPNGLPYVCHINDVKTDCRVDNLRWGTEKDNSLDRSRNNPNSWAKGSECGQAKLNEKIVRTIKSMLKFGISKAQIARVYHVRDSTIYHIEKGINWKHVN